MNDTEARYSLDAETDVPTVAAPDLPYRPPAPKDGSRRIALVGCGGISETHLEAYRKAGFDVAVLCSRTLAHAQRRRDAFYPNAAVTEDYRAVLRRDDVEIVDLTPHPAERAAMMEAAIDAGKHVLSQKPFVLDLDLGERLAARAADRGVRLAVNQNGRWAPHFAYIRQAVRAGLIGDPFAVRLAVDWDHNWIKDLPFDAMRHVVLYDFAIHWFDFVASLLPDETARRVYASLAQSPSQRAAPPLLAQATIEYDQAQVSLAFNADTKHAPQCTTTVIGSAGTARSVGPDIGVQTVTLTNRHGVCSPELSGTWFPDGFHGAMAELMCAIEEDREPLHNARDNLTALALCFAAVKSADTLAPVVPGSVRRLGDE